MEMQGSRPLAITQQQAWDALNDPEVLKACIPGCDSIEATGENAWAITMALKIGPVSARFKGAITLSDIHPPSSYTLGFEGTGGP
ncbi:MAG: carbon monoxide dehydrogenase subunit G, partial [Comamonas sp.]|nr:carbon monoxide dehydrogenase subunit G [Comamonas sp.]